jgi:hypothetical protein
MITDGKSHILIVTIRNFLLIFSISVFTFPTLALAGGGADSTNTSPTNTGSVQTGNGVTTSPPITQNGTSNPVVQTPITSNLGGLSSTTPLTQLPINNYQYSSTSTQFSGSNIGGVQCGLSAGAGVNNSNTSLQQVYTVDVRYNTAPCPDYKQLSEQETRRVEISVKGNNINTCIIARQNLASQGKDPNSACPPVDVNQVKSKN